MICCICKQEIEGYGHNPAPIPTEWPEQRCCDICNGHVVLPARWEQALEKYKDEQDENK